MEDFTLYGLFAAMVLFLLWLLFYLIPLNLWFQCILNNVKISLLQLMFMRWRRVPPSIIVNALINAKKAGLDLSADQLEAHYLAGGRVQRVVNALISADKANIPLDFKSATAIDLAGRDVEREIVQDFERIERLAHVREGDHSATLPARSPALGLTRPPFSSAATAS